MSVLGSPVNATVFVSQNLLFVSFFLITLLPLDAFAQPNTGSTNHCKDSQYVKACPETCAAKCDNVDSSAGDAVRAKLRSGDAEMLAMQQDMQEELLYLQESTTWLFREQFIMAFVAATNP
uniref:Uncharacterized protein n=1 Tax=Candidatus Kentrum sp. LFY TaxID=2126342 RepID=A0A450V899_9GAMM|nr:MAG: hypothetical protein BECKLFY1418B_GA0070995_12201 [Candidatus Kentron sp. LFY]